MKLKTQLTVFSFFLLAGLNAQQGDRPNVVFIMCDDLNDYQGIFGGHPQAKTPNMDALAREGVQFVNAQTNSPVCQPSRNSLFTGVYPHESQDFGWTKRTKQPVLKNNKPFIALFKENGYYTVGSGKLLHGNEANLWDKWGENEKHNYGPFASDGENRLAHPEVPEPFSTIGPVDGSFGRISGLKSSGKKGEAGWVYGWNMDPMRYATETDRDLLPDERHTRFALNVLKELEKNTSDQPFFMGLGFVRPHTPLHAPDRFFDLFPMEDLNLDDWLEKDEKDTYYMENFGSDKKGSKYYRMLLESYNGDRELALKTFLQAYLACVAFVDEQIGQVVDAVNQSRFRDNTIIVLTSDHGWQMGEKSFLFKNSPWEETCRIPLVVKVPQTESKQVNQPVSLIDLYPTLVDYCSLEGDHRYTEQGGDLGGNSLRPLIDDNSWQGPNGALTVVGNYQKHSKEVAKQNYSYRTKNWRYIHYSDGSEELYDHQQDPYEWNNLAYTKKFKTKKKELKAEASEIIGVNLE